MKTDFLNGFCCCISILIASGLEPIAADMLTQSGFTLDDLIESNMDKRDYILIMSKLVWKKGKWIWK